MEAPTYSAKQLSQILGVPGTAISTRKNERFTSEDLWRLRAKLSRIPKPIGGRKQLFLNFKGGTGKTSLSTSYAYRLAEMGHRVLLVDLDSQGHATKCLGYEGEDFPKTLLDVLIRETPMEAVIQKTRLRIFPSTPTNLGMSTIDLSLMPLVGREFKLRNALREIDGQYDLTIFD